MLSPLIWKNTFPWYTSCQQLIQIKPTFHSGHLTYSISYGSDAIIQGSPSSMTEISLYDLAFYGGVILLSVSQYWNLYSEQ